MFRKAIVMAVMFATMSTQGFAGSADNTTNASYFEGVWSGSWDLGSTSQDVTITIGKKGPKGYNKVTYEYGWTKSGTGSPVPPGSLVKYGREQDGVFTFSWKNMDGEKRTVTLKKSEENENAVKARFDLEGRVMSSQRPYYEGMLKRK